MSNDTPTRLEADQYTNNRLVRLLSAAHVAYEAHNLAIMTLDIDGEVDDNEMQEANAAIDRVVDLLDLLREE